MSQLKSLLILEHTAGKVTFTASESQHHLLKVEAKRDGTAFGFDLSKNEALELCRFIVRACASVVRDYEEE